EVGSLVWVGYCSESASQVDVDIDVGVELCPNWLIQKELNSGKRFTILISLIAYHQLGLGRNAKSSNQIKELIMRSGKKSIHAITTWVRRQPPKVKAFLAVVSGMAALVLLRFIVHDHDNLFVAAEAVHSLGISVLIYKLIKEKTCAGLSLKSQELTAIFLAVRLYCSFVMEYDIHTLLDLATFATTLWVIYMIRFKLKSSYMEEKDNFAIYYVVIPCAVLALFIHPSTSHHLLNRISWAFCVYLEAVSVLPQLRVMQNTQIVEPFTAHYVFALGVARFLSCAHWVLQV
ncbi:putative ER lumen protein-retaining receptor C28H8.4 isoform B, partial [Glycine soja]